MAELLKLEALNAFYGSSQILHGVDLRLEQGSVTCLLGLNGMGKTTTLRAIMGLVDHVEGIIAFRGRPLAGKVHQRARQGITLVPEDRRVFPTMTVEENLRIAKRAADHGRRGFDLAAVYEAFPRLRERAGQRAGTLSGGEQQMLAIGRALVANAQVVLLDEPSEGLAPSFLGIIRDSIRRACAMGMGVLLVEQSLALAMAVGDRFAILQSGQVVARYDRAEVAAAGKEILERHLRLG